MQQILMRPAMPAAITKGLARVPWRIAARPWLSGSLALWL